MLNSIKPPTTRSIPTCQLWLEVHYWVVLCSRFFLQGFIRFPVNWPLVDSSVTAQSWLSPYPQTSGSTNRLRAGQFRARPMTGCTFAPVGFDFTLSALFFRFRDWSATFLRVL